MNKKTLKTGLTACSVIALFVTLTMWLVAVLTETGTESPLFWTWVQTSDAPITGHYVMDWNYAAIYLVLLLMVMGAFITNMVMFTIPQVKDKKPNSSIALLCDIFVILGVFFALCALFLPLNMDIVWNEYNYDAEPARITATRILAFLGNPLAFIASIGTIGLTFRAEK